MRPHARNPKLWIHSTPNASRASSCNELAKLWSALYSGAFHFFARALLKTGENTSQTPTKKLKADIGK
jgi:hypothetical protein